MGLLSRGEAMVARVFAERESATVTYKPQSGTAKSLAAVGTDPQVETVQPTAAPTLTVVHSERDYLIRWSDWTAAGYTAKPARGDRITETINGTATTFEVTEPTGEPHWRWSGAERLVMRIHTARVS